MKQVKVCDFSQETIYVIECPECGCFIESSEDPEYTDSVCCDECYSVFEIVNE